MGVDVNSIVQVVALIPAQFVEWANFVVIVVTFNLIVLAGRIR